MKNCITGLTLVFTLLFSCTEAEEANAQQGEGTTTSDRILVFSRTEGFRHSSIADGISMFRDFGNAEGWEVIFTEDGSDFSPQNLADFDLIVFLNTTGDVLNQDQQSAMEAFIRSGGSFLGIHSATDTEYNWAWYGELAGAYFNGHPAIQDATLEVLDTGHPSANGLEGVWERRDEWYNFRDLQAGVIPLILLDEGSYSGGNMGDFHPISWYREFDGGRTFYTGMGHTRASYSELGFRSHILGGIRWCLGED